MILRLGDQKLGTAGCSVATTVQEYARWMNLPVYTGCTDRVNWFIFYANL